MIDTHCHLEDEKFTKDREKVLKRAHAAGVTRIINFGCTLEDSLAAVALAKKISEVYAGIGIHPEELQDFNSKTCTRLAELAMDSKVIAIGEIGLDYHFEKDLERRALQQKIFIEQLDLARQLNLPVCIHSRNAQADTLRILKSEGKHLRGVLHCYSGSLEMSHEIFKLGWLVGFDGPLTFKNSAKLLEIVKKAPRETILIETDAPYLAPTPHRGQRNEPAYIVEIAKKIAEVRDETFEEVSAYTTANAKELYKMN